MNKFEYWFLDTAVEEIIGLSWVIPDETGMLGINRKPLPISFAEIANILHKLFQSGNLLATTPEEQNYFSFSIGFKPSFSEIEAALKGNIGLFYFLTDKGGKNWESVSQPKWEQFLNWGGRIERENEEIMTCGSRQVGETILSLSHLLKPGSSIQYIIPHTEIWETITPWKATYWKMLPVGYQVRYQKREIEIDNYPNEPPEFIHKKQQANEVYLSLKKWYNNYFK